MVSLVLKTPTDTCGPIADLRDRVAGLGGVWGP